MATLDINGNILEAEPKTETDPPEYKMELAWFNIIGFIYLHYVTIVEAREMVQWNKTTAFGKTTKSLD